MSIAIRFLWITLLLLSVSQVVRADASSILFSETVTSDAFSSGKWLKSSDSKYSEQPIEIRGVKTAAKGFEDDLAIVLNGAHKHYGFGTMFDSPIRLTDEGLVIQYDLKFEETLACGGAYIKLIREGSIEGLTNETPYTIMFGPDRCGATNKVHFIIQYQNPITKQYEEKHFNETVPMKVDKNTHIYTLQLNGLDDTFAIHVDKKEVKKGSLLTHLRPAINPPEFIDDPDDKKPEDWVDEEKIADPEAKKPEDWDEDAPKMIPDPNAVKPDGWLDDGPLRIPDPEAKKPEDWDDDEDGVWEAPEIPNPACNNIGCGEWKAPSIKNPKYKGKWVAPKIPNPDYKGPWKARQIANSAYFTDPHPSVNLPSMIGLAVEVWTINAGIAFDNFIISKNLNEAHEFASKASDLKITAEKSTEKAVKKEAKKKELDEKKADAKTKGDMKTILMTHLESYVHEALDYIKENPYPVLGGVFALILAIAILLPKPKKSKTVKKEEVTDSSEGKEEIEYHTNPLAKHRKESTPTESTTNESISENKE